MLRVYGTLMPLRVLEEIRFWKMQEKEHTLVIRQIAPGLEPEYVRLMEQWEQVFAQAEMAATRWIEAVIRMQAPLDPAMLARIQALLASAAEQSNAFIGQLISLMQLSKALRENAFAGTVVQHIIRESEYFLGVLQAISFDDPGGWMTMTPMPARAEAPGLDPTADADNIKERVKLHIIGKTEKASAMELTSTNEGVWTPPAAEPHSPVPIGGHKLPPLPYPYDALEPYIDAETMRLHHDKHHQTYVDGLNKAETMLSRARKSGDFALVKHWERELAFHGAGHYLHSIFWNAMKPGGSKIGGPILPELSASFGSTSAFQRQFSEAADKVEGGGWAILVWSPRSRRLEILQAEKHQNLSQWDVAPLLPLDVWEHAYYLKYRNERRKYIDAWWNVVNWDYINDRFTAARSASWHSF
ncbi:Fe-Mn family superoxide dismutase [Paenibacillus hamazuiensis]|uniref:Fe-Mn family superoxide dismutase n=1 Tax=Paenibacillus hamazuiensis TaxID=2936508 RepID=UPI00200C0610|nr:Fe-Mn family superoxide dismutase [Paenibacillus hamazuiensis]